MKAIETSASELGIDLAASLAPEDLRPGLFVAIARIGHEYPSFFRCDHSLLPADEPVRIEWLPPIAGTPLRVEAVCLPFVLVKSPGGQFSTLDVRRVRLLRLTDSFARAAWKKLRKTRRE